MACDSVQKFCLAGRADCIAEALQDPCTWSEIAKTNIDIDTVLCSDLKNYWDVDSAPEALKTKLLARCIAPGSPNDPAVIAGTYVDPAQAATDKNKKVIGISVILIVVLIIAAIIYYF